jgi:hypothetical protein
VNVTRDSAAGRAYLDLQKQARKNGRLTDELPSLYALEGFLARLALSAHAATVLELVRQIAPIELDDGLIFDHSTASAVVIRDDHAYSGVRVSMTCSLTSARPAFHIDVNVGDPVIPAPEEVLVPRLLGGDAIRLLGYPLAMVLAEKIMTAVSRGTANTRWRDFADLQVLSSQRDVDGDELLRALAGVAEHRVVIIEPLRAALDGYAETAQSRYAVWRRKNQRDELPEDFGELLAGVTAFADPTLAAEIEGLTWRRDTSNDGGFPSWQ